MVIIYGILHELATQIQFTLYTTKDDFFSFGFFPTFCKQINGRMLPWNWKVTDAAFLRTATNTLTLIRKYFGMSYFIWITHALYGKCWKVLLHREWVFQMDYRTEQYSAICRFTFIGAEFSCGNIQYDRQLKNQPSPRKMCITLLVVGVRVSNGVARHMNLTCGCFWLVSFKDGFDNMYHMEWSTIR